jgi:hypothetical protein
LLNFTDDVSQKAKYSAIDLTDYSLLTNGLVSMLTYFSISGADKDYIPMFSWTNLFLAVLTGSITKEFSTLLSTKHEYYDYLT